MNVSKADYYSLGDVFDHIKSFGFYLKARLGYLFVVMLAGIGLGVLYYNVQMPKYIAETTFILDEKSSGGGLAGIASQFGFDIGNLTGGSSIFTGDNILDIFHSRRISNEVLLSETEEGNGAKTLADLFLDFKGWRRKWSSNAELKDITFNNVRGKGVLSPIQDSVLNEIFKDVQRHMLSAERLNKKGSIIRVQAISSNSTFSKLLSERMVDATAAMYLDLKTGTAQANISKLQRRSDSLLVLLNQKSFVAAASQPLDINPGIKSAIVPTEILTRDKSVLGTLYSEVTKNLEASKLLLSQQTPVIQILDRPGHTLEDNRIKLPFLILVSPIVAIAVFVIFAFPFFLVHSKKRNRKRISKSLPTEAETLGNNRSCLI
jgi:hypothetical protein